FRRWQVGEGYVNFTLADDDLFHNAFGNFALVLNGQFGPLISRSEFRPRRERQSRFGSFAPGGWWKRHSAGFSNQTWRRHGLNRIGTYNPDWAILKHDDTVLYLVRETKGTKNFEKLRNSEAEKIRCGRKHFETLKVDFDVVTAAGEV